jgi:hypothetical protein
MLVPRQTLNGGGVTVPCFLWFSSLCPGVNVEIMP